MDYFSALFLLALGFAVGLSGAIMPGPLLIYTINESLKKGKWTGAHVIFGHALVEILIFVLLSLGLLELVSSGTYTKAIYLVGGLALILMAAYSVKDLGKETKQGAAKNRYGTVIGGILFTAFNPGFPIWWMTAGAGLLAEGLQRMGFLGMVLVLVGHWGADLGWFLLVSLTTSKSSKMLFEKEWYKAVRIILSAALVLAGAYFLSKAA